MADKERYQNPVVGDTIRLKLYVFNSNAPANVESVENVEIYILDPTNISETNTDGRRLVSTLDGSSVVSSTVGQYYIDLEAVDPCFTIGTYIDVWNVITRADEPSSAIVNYFEIYPDLWYSSPIPLVYDFNFIFRPNRLRAGAKQYLTIDVIPNVPRATDLERYYRNLVISASLTVSIEKVCGDCMPAGSDLNMIVENAPIDFREKNVSYFFLDTEALEMDCGIYDVWFEMELGSNKYISDKQQLQIYS